MLKNIASVLFSTPLEKTLGQYHINATHSFVKPLNLRKLTELFKNQKQRVELLEYIKKQLSKPLNNKNFFLQQALRLKLLLVLHQAIKRFPRDLEIEDIIINCQISMKVQTKDKTDLALIQYIHQSIYIFYVRYLQKLCINRQSVIFISQFLNRQQSKMKEIIEKKKGEKNISMANYAIIDLINHGFSILNVANFLITSREALNKMGRYHPEFIQIRNIYLGLVKDLDDYNIYIKRTVALIVRRNLDKEEADHQTEDKTRKQKNHSRSKSKSKSQLIKKEDANFSSPPKIMKDISVTLKEIKIIRQIENQANKTISIDKSTKEQSYQKIKQKKQDEQIRHEFLYLCECQKLSDQLYNYYYNRYYFKYLSQTVQLPSFLNVEKKYYQTMKDRLKRTDHNLLKLINRSKYEKEDCINRRRSTTNQMQLNYTQLQSIKRNDYGDLRNSHGNNRNQNYTVYEGDLESNIYSIHQPNNNNRKQVIPNNFFIFNDEKECETINTYF